MPNFFLDNEDIQFLFKHLDLAALARIQEDDLRGGTTATPITRRRMPRTPSITITACWKSSAKSPER